MNRKRRTRITVETERIVVVNQGRQPPVSWCADCGARTQMLRPEEAAAITGITTRTVYRWVETGKLHFAESPDGLLLICLDSLTRNCTT